jgi:hypothetical protein
VVGIVPDDLVLMTFFRMHWCYRVIHFWLPEGVF